MSEAKHTYYVVDRQGNVYCTDGGFHCDQTFGKYKSYKRLTSALNKAREWNRWKSGVRVMDEAGNEVTV